LGLKGYASVGVPCASTYLQRYSSDTQRSWLVVRWESQRLT
jgi:hypothetical protein